MAPLIALSGFMGSGKTTVGTALSSDLGLAFVDLDQAVEARLGAGIDAFFQNHGEEAFRTVESEVLAEVLSRDSVDGVILALGGGTLDHPCNRVALSKRFVVVHLKVDAEEAWERVVGSGRPLAKDRSSFRQLASRRSRTYEDTADWVIPTSSRKVDDVVADVEALVLGRLHELPRRWARRLSGTTRASIIVGGIGALDTLTSRAEALRRDGGRLRVFTDDNVLATQGDTLLQRLGIDKRSDVFAIPPGERSKSASVLEMCWGWLADLRTTRDDVVVAVGGGVVGDLAGFAAATYHRGLALWQVPTSLLAQVDSSVGGKTAINLPSGKNLVGAFHQPDLVVADPATMMTLPNAEYTGALGEVVKHALLDSEESLCRLEASVDEIATRNAEALGLLVKRNIWFKASVVEEDEREAGRRAVLNLGHTTAHALESGLGYGSLSHGQAVALGLLVALAVSEQELGLSPAVRTRTTLLLERLGLQTKVSMPDAEVLVQASALDKKQRSGSSGFVCLRQIGEPVWGVDVSRELLINALGVIAA